MSNQQPDVDAMERMVAQIERWLADGRPDPALAFTSGPARRLADLINAPLLAACRERDGLRARVVEVERERDALRRECNERELEADGFWNDYTRERDNAAAHEQAAVNALAERDDVQVKLATAEAEAERLRTAEAGYIEDFRSFQKEADEAVAEAARLREENAGLREEAARWRFVPDARGGHMLSVLTGDKWYPEAESLRLRAALEAERDRLRPYTEHTHAIGVECDRPACAAYARINEVLTAQPSAQQRQEASDWAATDTAIREQAKRVLPDATVDGDSFAVPTADEVARMLADEVGRLREAVGAKDASVLEGWAEDLYHIPALRNYLLGLSSALAATAPKEPERE